MAERTGIAWTDATWNPIIGCSRVSEGCRNCYAERAAIRMAGPAPREHVDMAYDSGGVEVGPAGRYHGLVKSTPDGPRWTGEVRLVEEALTLPLHWRRPRRIFVNSMGDLFHEQVPDEWIDRVFAVMALAPQHTFQVLTKRPERMRAYELDRDDRLAALLLKWGDRGGRWWPFEGVKALRWDEVNTAALSTVKRPLSNVQSGVSVENQATADARIPLLLQAQAAARFVSYEPALGPVDFLSPWHDWLRGWTTEPEHSRDGSCRDGQHKNCPQPVQVQTEKINWLIVGCESGPQRRNQDGYEACARSAIGQARAAGVPVFHKQMSIRGRVSHDPAEWPSDLRVQEWPT